MMPRRYDYSRTPEILEAFDADPHCGKLAKRFHMPYAFVYKVVIASGRTVRRKEVFEDSDSLGALPPIPTHLLVPYVPRTVPNGQVSLSMRAASINRREAGPEPLSPFHPIAKAALPRLKSLENV